MDLLGHAQRAHGFLIEGHSKYKATLSPQIAARSQRAMKKVWTNAVTGSNLSLYGQT